MPTTGAILAEELKRCGVTCVFGLVGVPVTPLAVAIQDRGIRFIAHRSESAVMYAAGCYGYLNFGLTERPGFALCTGGPGFMNALPGLAHAMINRFPLVLICGSASREMNHPFGVGFQEADQYQIVTKSPGSFCKKAYAIRSPSDLAEVIDAAILAATQGTPGAVYVDIPADVINLAGDRSPARLLFTPDPDPAAHMVSAALVEKAVELFKSAKHPLLVVGEGAAMARAEKRLLHLVDELSVPFLPTPMGRGLIPDSHPLCMAANRSALMRDADVAIVCGARLNWLLHFGNPPRWSRDVKFIIIDFQGDCISQRHDLQDKCIELRGSIEKTLDHFVKMCKAMKVTFDYPTDLAEEARSRKEEARRKVENDLSRQHTGDGSKLLHMRYKEAMYSIQRDFIDKLADRRTPSSSVYITSEGANTMDISRTEIEIQIPRGRLDAGTWGTMGVSLPYIISTRLSVKSEDYIVGMVGDSAIGFSLAELETIARYQMKKILIVVFNNGGIYSGRVRKEAKDDDPSPTQLSQETQYSTIMNGIIPDSGFTVATTPELKVALATALQLCKKHAVLINILIHREDGLTTGFVAESHREK